MQIGTSVIKESNMFLLFVGHNKNGVKSLVLHPLDTGHMIECVILTCYVRLIYNVCPGVRQIVSVLRMII